MTSVNNNQKPMSKNSLFEKLDNHVNKLMEEVEKKTEDFQKSFNSMLESINSYRVRGPCQSMQDYFNIIQELNKNFDDLENKSSLFVDNICRLRISSLLIDGLNEPEDYNSSSSSSVLVPETPLHHLNGSSLNILGSLSPINNAALDEITIDENDKECQEKRTHKDSDTHRVETTDKNTVTLSPIVTPIRLPTMEGISQNVGRLMLEGNGANLSNNLNGINKKFNFKAILDSSYHTDEDSELNSPANGVRELSRSFSSPDRPATNSFGKKVINTPSSPIIDTTESDEEDHSLKSRIYSVMNDFDTSDDEEEE